VWEVGKPASWFRSYLIKQQASTKNEDALRTFDLRQMLKIMKHVLFFLSLLENQFPGSLKWLVLHSLRFEFFTLLLEMNTATVLIGDCPIYVDDLGGEGLDDSMM